MLRTRRSSNTRASLRGFESLEYRQLMAADTLAIGTENSLEPTREDLTALYDAVATIDNPSPVNDGGTTDEPVLYFNYPLDTETDTTDDEMVTRASADFPHVAAGELIALSNAHVTTDETTKLLHTCNANYKSMAMRELIDMHISEIILPTLSGDSKDPAKMTVKLDPEEVRDKKGDGDVVSGAIDAKHKDWHCANFRVEIGGLPCDYVSEAELPKLTVKAVQRPRAIDPCITSCHESPPTADVTVSPAENAFRPTRVTPKTFVPGTQTAVVVGQSGEEFYTNKYGSVKVQFHWDRDGANDENSFCWIRVPQDCTGKSWGGISIPRIGQEVVVDFLEGDPDRPVVLQSHYNGEQVPPYTLPTGPRVTGLESTSTKYNEFRMDDTKGEEQIRERDDRRLEFGNEPVAPYDAAATFDNASGADNGASSDQPVLYFNYFLDTEAVGGGSTTLGFGANEPSQ